MSDVHHSQLACGRRERINGRGAVKASKRQDLNPNRGMATVDKELSTHPMQSLLAGCLWVLPLAGHRELPTCSVG